MRSTRFIFVGLLALLALGPSIVHAQAVDPTPSDVFGSAVRGEVDQLKIYLEMKPDMRQLVTRSRESLLEITLRRRGENYTEVCRLLVDLGLRPDLTRRSTRETALHMAARLGEAKLVEYFLGAGADADVRDGLLMTPLHRAALAGHPAVIATLAAADAMIERGPAPAPALHAAIEGRHLEAVRALLDAGASPDASDELRRAPLEIALTLPGGLPEAIVRELVRRGANLEGENQVGLRYLHAEANKGRLDGVRLLLELGADPKSLSRDGTSALHAAATAGALDVIQELVIAGTPLDVVDRRFKTALEFAKDDTVRTALFDLGCTEAEFVPFESLVPGSVLADKTHEETYEVRRIEDMKKLTTRPFGSWRVELVAGDDGQRVLRDRVNWYDGVKIDSEAVMDPTTGRLVRARYASGELSWTYTNGELRIDDAGELEVSRVDPAVQHTLTIREALPYLPQESGRQWIVKPVLEPGGFTRTNLRVACQGADPFIHGEQPVAATRFWIAGGRGELHALVSPEGRLLGWRTGSNIFRAEQDPKPTSDSSTPETSRAVDGR